MAGKGTPGLSSGGKAANEGKEYHTREEADGYLKTLLDRRRVDAREFPPLAFKDFIKIFDGAKEWRSGRYREVILYALNTNCGRFHKANLVAAEREDLKCVRTAANDTTADNLLKVMEC